MLSVVCWLWRPAPTYRSQFAARHVNTLASMVARNYLKPHRMICVTDMPAGIDPSIEIVPLWKDHSRIVHPFGQRNPSCYRRLKAFSPEARDLFGERFVSIDLDCVITADMVPLWDCTDEFKIWGDTNKTTPYNGSMFIMNAGARRQVWEQFNPDTSPHHTRKLGYFGSDQAWIAACLGDREARWTKADGVYSFRNEIKNKFVGGTQMPLPRNARVVMFHGREDPWGAMAQTLPWVRRHYR